MDIGDVLLDLHKKFPYVEFVVQEIDKGRISFYHFKLKKLLYATFDPPIKTSICVLKSENITEFEFAVIERKMQESFSRTKLLGLI